MASSIGKGWFTEHRGWEDLFSAACGVLIVLSPVLAEGEVSVAVAISAGLVGVIIIMLGLLDLMEHQRWEELLELLCGFWVVVSPLVLGYDGVLRLSHYLLGAVVVLLALLELWQDRSRHVTA